MGDHVNPPSSASIATTAARSLMRPIGTKFALMGVTPWFMRIGFMNQRPSTSSDSPRQTGFTVLHVLVVLTLASFLFAAGISTMFSQRIRASAENDLIVARNFMIHYLELIKDQPVDDIEPGAAIFTQTTGTNIVATIHIPTSGIPIHLDSSDFQKFHPDLVWLEDQNPTMSVRLKTLDDAGKPRAKHVTMEVSWDSPLGKGNRQSLIMDILRADNH